MTGDSELVTQHVCAKLGMPVTGVLSGAEIAQLDDQALQARVEPANLFCRVNPAQKNRIILGAEARGHVVGYLGDGINDAPSLHSADVGISVETAVDVAKEAADIILLRAGPAGPARRRARRPAHLRQHLKYIMMGTSSNFGNMFSMAAASVFLPFLPMLPTQILLNNVLYDLSEVAIPLDHVDGEEVRGPQAWDMNFIRNFMWMIGPVSSLFDFLTFYVLLAVLKAERGAVPDRLVRRIAGHPGARDLRHSHTAQPVYQPTPRRARSNLSGCRARSADTSVHGAGADTLVSIHRHLSSWRFSRYWS